jgi:paraquat-inducible protein B
MSKKVSPTLIGIFVLGAIALVVIGIMTFGTGRFFRIDPGMSFILMAGSRA